MTLSPVHSPSYRCSGFTLVELALVLLIASILLTSVLSTLSTQIEIRKYRATKDTMALIQEALIGYAITSGGLPCSDNDGSNDGRGDIGTCTLEGNVPWVDLGLTPDHGEDAWSNPIIYRADISYAPTFASMGTTSGLAVQDLSGTTTLSAGGTNAPIAILVSYGNDNSANGDNGNNDATFTKNDYVYGLFDDEVTWLSRHILIGRWISAGKALP